MLTAIGQIFSQTPAEKHRKHAASKKSLNEAMLGTNKASKIVKEINTISEKLSTFHWEVGKKLPRQDCRVKSSKLQQCKFI